MPATFQWRRITEAGYARHESILGIRVCEAEGQLWRQVRPFYFRPLFPLRELSPGDYLGPGLAWLGGLQHATPPGAESNSALHYLLFDRPGDYSLEKMSSERRRRVRRAAEQYAIRRVEDVAEFQAKGYPLYLDFHRRTGYGVATDRLQHAKFVAWADALFKIPNILILAAEREGRIEGFSTSFMFENTLNCASLICLGDSLSRYLPDLMLHVIRDSAAATPGIERIFPGMYHGNTSLDAFYLERGARLLRKPAQLSVNPLCSAFLKKFKPQLYRRMVGELGPEEEKWLLPPLPAPAPGTSLAPDLAAAACHPISAASRAW